MGLDRILQMSHAGREGIRHPGRDHLSGFCRHDIRGHSDRCTEGSKNSFISGYCRCRIVSNHDPSLGHNERDRHPTHQSKIVPDLSKRRTAGWGPDRSSDIVVPGGPLPANGTTWCKRESSIAHRRPNPLHDTILQPLFSSKTIYQYRLPYLLLVGILLTANQWLSPMILF